MEWSVVGADAEGDRELAAASEGMDSKGRVTGGNEDRSFIREPSRSEVGSSFEVRQESNAFDEITASRLWMALVTCLYASLSLCSACDLVCQIRLSPTELNNGFNT